MTFMFSHRIRPSWESICMDLAVAISKRSTCSNPDRKVGCVIVDDSHQRVLAWGYNGVAAGETHSCEYHFHKGKKEKNEYGYSCFCVHAEQNALAKMNTFEPCDKIMYLTLSPCMICSRLIVNSGIKKVYILELYSSHEKELELLRKRGVEVILFKQ